MKRRTLLLPGESDGDPNDKNPLGRDCLTVGPTWRIYRNHKGLIDTETPGSLPNALVAQMFHGGDQAGSGPPNRTLWDDTDGRNALDQDGQTGLIQIQSGN